MRRTCLVWLFVRPNYLLPPLKASRASSVSLEDILGRNGPKLKSTDFCDYGLRKSYREEFHPLKHRKGRVFPVECHRPPYKNTTVTHNDRRLLISTPSCKVSRVLSEYFSLVGRGLCGTTSSGRKIRVPTMSGLYTTPVTSGSKNIHFSTVNSSARRTVTVPVLSSSPD